MVSCVFSIDCEQVVSLAPQELFALLALAVFLERHHVDRAHRLDPRLHLVVVRFRRDEILADQQVRPSLRNQFLGLRVELRHASLAQIIAVGVVARSFDLSLAAFGAQLFQRLALAPQFLIDLAGARASPPPTLAPALPSALASAPFRRADRPPACASCSQAVSSSIFSCNKPPCCWRKYVARCPDCASSSDKRPSMAAALARRSDMVASSSRRATTRS